MEEREREEVKVWLNKALNKIRNRIRSSVVYYYWIDLGL